MGDLTETSSVDERLKETEKLTQLIVGHPIYCSEDNTEWEWPLWGGELEIAMEEVVFLETEIIFVSSFDNSIN